MSVDISVIVPTRDRPGLLAAMLMSVASGTLARDRYEIIVADNGTTDATARIVERSRGNFDRLVHVRVAQAGLHEARHAGLAVAQSELLVFADDDIVARPTWLAAIGAAFHDPQVALAGGNNLPRFPTSPPAWLTRLWEIRHRHGRYIAALSILDLGTEARDIPAAYVFGCNFAVRRSAVLAANGFHPDGFPADMIRYRGDGETHISATVEQAGLRAIFVPGASVEHVVSAERMTPEYFEHRHFAQGVSDSYAQIRSGTQVSKRSRLASWVRLWRPPSLFRLRLRWRRAYQRGYRYHQHAVAHDSALLAWVRKPTYL